MHQCLLLHTRPQFLNLLLLKVFVLRFLTLLVGLDSIDLLLQRPVLTRFQLFFSLYHGFFALPLLCEHLLHVISSYFHIWLLSVENLIPSELWPINLLIAIVGTALEIRRGNAHIIARWSLSADHGREGLVGRSTWRLVENTLCYVLRLRLVGCFEYTLFMRHRQTLHHRVGLAVLLTCLGRERLSKD